MFFQSSWCLTSSPLAKAALGLLGPTSAVWLWQVWRAKSYTSDSGPQSNIGKARKYAKKARRLLIPVMACWLLTLYLYAQSYISLKGKGCDATFTSSANTWVKWFVWSLVPLIVFFCALAYQHLQFRRYDETARGESR